MKRFFWAILGLAALTGLDQWTKYLAVSHLQGQPAIPLWEGVFELQFVTNRGAAFGIFQNQRWIFLVLTAVVMVALIGLFWKLPRTRRFLPLQVLCVVVEAGALGNMIDRIRLGYVIDFLYLKLIDFPVFNVADCYVTGGVFLAAILLFFYYKEEEWNFLSRKKDGTVSPEESASIGMASDKRTEDAQDE